MIADRHARSNEPTVGSAARRASGSTIEVAAVDKAVAVVIDLIVTGLGTRRVAGLAGLDDPVAAGLGPGVICAKHRQEGD